MVEREVVYSIVVLLKFSVEFPVWEVLCGRYSGNRSVRRRGRRVVARTLKHILLFATDPLSITLSLLFFALHHTHIIDMLGIVCVPHLC